MQAPTRALQVRPGLQDGLRGGRAATTAQDGGASREQGEETALRGPRRRTMLCTPSPPPRDPGGGFCPQNPHDDSPACLERVFRTPLPEAGLPTPSQGTVQSFLCVSQLALLGLSWKWSEVK